MLNKHQRRSSARKTIKILNSGMYKDLQNNKYNIEKLIKNSIKNSYLYKNDKININDKLNNKNGLIVFQKQTSQIGIENEFLPYLTQNKICALNFASGKYPCGGFLKGSSAQEESLCRCSSLYYSINQFKEFYKNNKKYPLIYSNYIIYSEGVVFFKDREEKNKNPYLCSIITCPAVNLNKNNLNKNEINLIMINRIEKIFHVAIKNDVDTLILGAYGCGVFKNNPEDVSKYFNEVINNMKYRKYFKKIKFSIPNFEILKIFIKNIKV